MSQFTPTFEILPISVRDVLRTLAKDCSPERIILFGSRARGNCRENSDFDIAVVGKRCSEQVWANLLIRIPLEPLTLYSIDVVEFEKLPQEYRDVIRQEGLVLYE